jgi:hypothetical protein
MPLMHDPEERAAASSLRRHVDQHRAAGRALEAVPGRPDAYRRYQERVHPILRQAVGDCDRIREPNFQSVQEAGMQARDEARRATAVVVPLSFAACGFMVIVSVRPACPA